MSTILRDLPPRSILFVPGSRPDLAGKAATGAADAVCIDLEDGVAADARADARRGLDGTVAAARTGGKPVLVRLNAGTADYAEDIDALSPGVDAVVLAKAAGASHAADVAGRLDARGRGDTGILPMVEDIAGIDAFAALGARDAARLVGITIGAEDLAAELQCDPDGRAIEHAFYRLLECARRMGVPLLGFPGSIANFADLDAYREQVTAGAAMGAAGAFCIHPRQVAVLNDVFMPSNSQVDWARAVVEALDRAVAGGAGAVAVNGRMVDEAVARRAREILARFERFNA